MPLGKKMDNMRPVTPLPTQQAQQQRRLLLTAAGPTMRRVLYELALPTFTWYAKRWGYDVRAVDLAKDGAAADANAQSAKWAKIDLIRDALADNALVVWIDADVLLLRSDEDVADHLSADDIHALALEQVPAEHRINPNTGVWLLRGPDALTLLDAVDAAGTQPGPWADQGALLAALGWDRGDESYRGARPGVGNEFLSRTSWLPGGWNQPFLGERQTGDSYNSAAQSYADRPSVAAPHALHFMGLTPDARYRYMKAALARVPARSG